MSRTNYNASDVIARTRDRVLYAYKIQNDFFKQKQLTLRGVQSGTPGAMPQPALIIPTLAEASQSITPAEFFDISLGLQADYDREYGGSTGEGTGTGTGDGSLPMNIYYISGNNGTTITQNIVNSSTNPASVTVEGNGTFGSTQSIYGAVDFIFTVTLPAVIPNNGGTCKVGLLSQSNGANLYMVFGGGGTQGRLVINGNGGGDPDVVTFVGGHTIQLRYMQSTSPPTVDLYNATTSTVIFAPRTVSPNATNYAIFLEGGNWGVASSPHTPITLTNINVLEYAH
jgi:hypothetical protein